MSFVGHLSEEITIIREPTFPSVAAPADAQSIGKISEADSVPSTEEESTDDESIVCEVIEIPYIENSYAGSAKETGEDASRKQVDEECNSTLKAKWKDARKSLKAMHLFPKQVRKNRGTKKLLDENPESIEVVDPKASKQADVATSGVASSPPSAETKHASNKHTLPTTNGSSFGNQVELASPPPTVGINPGASAFTKVKSAKASLTDQERNGQEPHKIDKDMLIKKQDSKEMLKEKDDVDDIIYTMFDEFDIIDRFEQEFESGCKGIDLQSTAEMMFISCVSKVDTMNACGCRFDSAQDDQSISSSDEKTFPVDDDTPNGLEVGFQKGPEEGMSEILTENRSGIDPSNYSELDNSSIDNDETIVATGFFGEEEMCDTFSFDNNSLATEYDDFKKAMQLLKNRAAKKGLSEAGLLEKIQTEQQRRNSHVQLT
jgi:hypothetical protein